MPTPSRFVKENHSSTTTVSKPHHGRNKQPVTPPITAQQEEVPPRLRSNLLTAPTPMRGPPQHPQTPRQPLSGRQPGPPPTPVISPYTDMSSQVLLPGPPRRQLTATPFAATDGSDGRLAALQAELAESRRCLAESKARESELQAQLSAVDTHQPRRKSLKVVPIPKPKGEAGDGFQLQQVMQLDDDEAKRILYSTIRRTVHICARAAGVDFSKPYSQQSYEILADVFKAVRQTHPYLTTTRFPNDWATAELLKQYIRNVRAQEARLRQQAAKAELNAGYVDGEEAVPPTPAKRAAYDNSDGEGLERRKKPSKRPRISHSRPEEYHSAGSPEAGPSRHPQALLGDDDNYSDGGDTNGDYRATPFNAGGDDFY